MGPYDLVEETRTQTSCFLAMGPFHHLQASSPALLSGKLEERAVHLTSNNESLTGTTMHPLSILTPGCLYPPKAVNLV